MAKRVFIIHGFMGSPYIAWIPWLKTELEKKGLEVYAPEMPDPYEPDIREWVEKIKVGIGEPDKDTILVGYSLGSQAVLRYLEKLGKGAKVGGVLLIAPFLHLNLAAYDDAEQMEILRPWVEKPIDLQKVAAHSASFVAIFSEDDPYVPIADSKIFSSELNASIILEENKGHMNEERRIVKLQRILSETLKMADS